jgi:hypothetical protein
MNASIVFSGIKIVSQFVVFMPMSTDGRSLRKGTSNERIYRFLWNKDRFSICVFYADVN